MKTLEYVYKYRSSELANWQTDYTKTIEVGDDKFHAMVESCELIGMTYSHRYKSFYMENVDKLHCLIINVK